MKPWVKIMMFNLFIKNMFQEKMFQKNYNNQQFWNFKIKKYSRMKTMIHHGILRKNSKSKKIKLLG